MAKRRDRKTKRVEAGQAHGDHGTTRAGMTKVEPGPKMSVKEYEREMRRLHGERGAPGMGQGERREDLHRVRGSGHGRQGGHDQAHRRTGQSARLQGRRPAAPTEREKSQMYIQRYLPHFPAGGEVVIFDRSWYNRAGVERVMGSAPQVSGSSSNRCQPSRKRWSTPGSS